MTRTPTTTGRAARIGRCTLPVLAALSLIVTACSLSGEDRVTELDADQLGPELANTTTTTTTTTTVPTTTAPASLPTLPIDSTTAPPAVATQTTTLFYAIGNTDLGVSSVRVELNEPVQLRDVLAELERPRSEALGDRLRSAVRPGLVKLDQTTLTRGTLTIALDSTVYDAMQDTQRRRAIAQLVLTFTVFSTPDAGAIGLVTFVVDGTPISVFVPATETSSEPGATLAFEDFQPLLGETPVATETTPPATSAPPTSPPATTLAP